MNKVNEGKAKVLGILFLGHSPYFLGFVHGLEDSNEWWKHYGS